MTRAGTRSVTEATVSQLDVTELAIPGCLVLHTPVLRDRRGAFNKMYSRAALEAAGVDFPLAEQYVTTSSCGVVRGMHLQLPPHEHHKVVQCLSGRALDVLVDCRETSPTYGQHVTLELAGDSGDGVLVPPGVAHGFCARSDNAIMLYRTSSAHAPDFDTGVRWDSFGLRWPIASPIISDRDQQLPPFQEFSYERHR
jgi:dTDP-4-dehydrorhamnose 3,5-epimerase